MVQVLLSSRRFVILREEIDTFIRDDLETLPSDISSDHHSRALLLFALVLVQTLQVSLFGSNAEDIEFLSLTVLEALRIETRDVTPTQYREPADRIIPLPSDDLPSQLAYHTFGAVGKSGYTRATISRISRRAHCSPGAIYKLYPSKEDLVIAAVRRIMEAPWISVFALAHILDEGVLAQLLYSAASTQNEVRKNFTLEIAMASAHSDKIRAAVETQLQGLEFLVTLMEDIDDAEKSQLRQTIRIVVNLTLGTSFLSTVTKATESVDFNQFAEPLRRSILMRNGSAWEKIRRQLDGIAEQFQTPERRRLATEGH
jgi:AcrR family transcriptional regulator